MSSTDRLELARRQAAAMYATKLPARIPQKHASAEKNAGVFDFMRKAAPAASHATSAASHAVAAPLEAARTAATQAHATHLGSVMPSVDTLRKQYGHVTPDAFRASYGKSVGETGVWPAMRGHTSKTQGAESFIHTAPDGTQRVSDSGLAYLHANKNYADTASLVPDMHPQGHQIYALRGGRDGMLNGAQGLDIHGQIAADEVAQNSAALSRMAPRSDAQKALWERIHDADTRAKALRSQDPTGARGLIQSARAPAPTATVRTPKPSAQAATLAPRRGRAPAPAQAPQSLSDHPTLPLIRDQQLTG